MKEKSKKTKSPIKKRTLSMCIYTCRYQSRLVLVLAILSLACMASYICIHDHQISQHSFILSLYACFYTNIVLHSFMFLLLLALLPMQDLAFLFGNGRKRGRQRGGGRETSKAKDGAQARRRWRRRRRAEMREEERGQ